MEFPGLFDGGRGVVKNGACGGVSSIKGGIAAVIALVVVGRVGVVVTASWVCCGTRRGARGIVSANGRVQSTLISESEHVCHPLPVAAENTGLKKMCWWLIERQC